jgi:hypothetical protein
LGLLPITSGRSLVIPNCPTFLLQYFINYNLKKGWYLTWQPTMTANWNAPDGYRWVVPLGGGVGHNMRLGSQPVNAGTQFYGNAVHPPAERLGRCGCKLHSYSQGGQRKNKTETTKPWHRNGHGLQFTSVYPQETE